jgi:hypothetical protein
MRGVHGEMDQSGSPNVQHVGVARVLADDALALAAGFGEEGGVGGGDLGGIQQQVMRPSVSLRTNSGSAWTEQPVETEEPERYDSEAEGCFRHGV